MLGRSAISSRAALGSQKGLNYRGIASQSGGGGIPLSLQSKMLLWVSPEEQTDDYYIDKIGVQDRQSTLEGVTAGVIHPGRAVLYDTSKDQYSSTFGNTPANFRLANNSVTLSFWMNMTVAPPSAAGLVYGAHSTTNGAYSALVFPNGTIQFYCRHSGGTIAYESPVMVDSAWHHYCVIMNKAGNWQVFIDGVLKDTQDISGLTFGNYTNVFNIGGQATYYVGTRIYRDIRLFSSAINPSDVDVLYRQEYLAGVTSWWMCEGGNESDLNTIKDCVGTNHLFNYLFDAGSLVSGAWPSLLNKYGYSNTAYTGDDILLYGDFSDATKWGYTASRFTVDSGSAWFKAVDALAPTMTSGSNIVFPITGCYTLSYEVILGDTATFSIVVGATTIVASASHAVGVYTVDFRCPTNTQLIITGDHLGGAFRIDNITIKQKEVSIVPPLISSSNPLTDIYARALTFFGLAKRNLLKVDADTVQLNDYDGDSFNATELIVINDWYDANGVATEIDVVDIEPYQTGRQYYKDGELIIIRSDVTLTEAEDVLLKKKLNLGNLSPQVVGYIYKAEGTLTGDNADIYKAKNLYGETPYFNTILKMQINPVLNPSNKYIAIGWADFFVPEDPQIMLALCTKYDFQHSFYRQIQPKSDNPLETISYNRTELKMIETQGSFDGNHTFAHISHFYSTNPHSNGRTSPSANDMRLDRGDGTNEFGYDITDTVDDSIGASLRVSWCRLSNEIGATAWEDLSDGDCYKITEMLGAFGMLISGNGQKVLESLDVLSARYCGTVGCSVLNEDYTSPRVPNTVGGVEPDDDHRIQGGIFQGAATTENHEIWERLLIIDVAYKKEFEGKMKDDTFRVTSGGVSDQFSFVPEGGSVGYVDKLYSQLLYGGNIYHSSIYNTDRSFWDCLRNAGYIATLAAQGDGYGDYVTGTSRLECQSIYQRNLLLKKPDNIGDGFTNTIRHWLSTLTETDIDNALASEDVEKYIYDLCATDARFSSITAYTPGNQYAYINEALKFIAWGKIPDSADDSGSAGVVAKRPSMALAHEALMRFCKRAGITIISHEQAIELAMMDYSPDNYFPNPDMETTALTVLGSANAPVYPDGWNGGEVLTEDTGEGNTPILHIDTEGTYFTRQYAIKPGTFDLTFKGRGVATLKVRKILNKDTYNRDSGAAFTEINSITINSSDSYSDFTEQIVIEDADMEVYDTPTTPAEEAYQNYMRGYGDKVCGIQIELVVSDENYIKIGNCNIA
jgi:hypothetical protein